MAAPRHRSCLVSLYEPGTVYNEYGEPTGTSTLWGQRWASFIPERGVEENTPNERRASVRGAMRFDYLELCEGNPPLLMDENRLMAMRIDLEGISFDIVGFAPDLMTRRDVMLSVQSKVTGA